MKKEYTEKMNAYQTPEYEAFLKEKCVLDAKQFLQSSMIYLNYALMTARLYDDVGKKNIAQSNKDPFYNIVEVLGWHYDAHTLLNKLTLEWVSHISNSLDCLLQYINAALHLELPIKSVSEKRLLDKLSAFQPVKDAMESLWNDETINYIRSVYNFSKHTLDLYGGSTLLDVLNGKRDIHIPDFKYRNTIYKEKSTSELINYYETIIGKYIDLMDAVDLALQNATPIPNRYHVEKMIIDGNALGEIKGNTDIVLYSSFNTSETHKSSFWIEDLKLTENQVVEIMPPHTSRSGQYLEYIDTIEVMNNGIKVGELTTVSTEIDTSVLSYNKYVYKKSL